MLLLCLVLFSGFDQPQVNRNLCGNIEKSGEARSKKGIENNSEKSIEELGEARSKKGIENNSEKSIESPSEGKNKREEEIILVNDEMGNIINLNEVDIQIREEQIEQIEQTTERIKSPRPIAIKHIEKPIPWYYVFLAILLFLIGTMAILFCLGNLYFLYGVGEDKKQFLGIFLMLQKKGVYHLWIAKEAFARCPYATFVVRFPGWIVQNRRYKLIVIKVEEMEFSSYIEPEIVFSLGVRQIYHK